MARKLKTYQTSLGFFDLAIAAPSMKAALEAWGADSNLFHQGAAKESDDPDVVAATMAAPGVILKRPVGSNGPFEENAGLPTHLAARQQSEEGRSAQGEPQTAKAPKRASRRGGRSQGRNRIREGANAPRARTRKEDAARLKKRERRKHDVDKAQSAMDEALQRHGENGRGNSSRTPSH